MAECMDIKNMDEETRRSAAVEIANHIVEMPFLLKSKKKI
jgi:hypothetical protein